MDQDLEVHVEFPERPYDDVGADAAIDGDVAAGIGEADVGGVIGYGYAYLLGGCVSEKLALSLWFGWRVFGGWIFGQGCFVVTSRKQDYAQTENYAEVSNLHSA